MDALAHFRARKMKSRSNVSIDRLQVARLSR